MLEAQQSVRDVFLSSSTIEEQLDMIETMPPHIMKNLENSVSTALFNAAQKGTQQEKVRARNISFNNMETLGSDLYIDVHHAANGTKRAMGVSRELV